MGVFNKMNPLDGMRANYLKIAYRNLVRNKIYSFINIFGLAIGIATCLVIMLYIQDELSYDRFNEKANQIVRIVFKANINGGKISEANVMPPTAQALKNDYPEVEKTTRIRSMGMPKVIIGSKLFKNAKLAYVDSNFFEVFTIPLLNGNSKTALNQPNTLVLSQALAHTYFGNENPIGKSIYFKKGTENQLFKITGVFDKIPTNSHFHFDMLGSMASDTEANSSSWMTSNYFTYLLLAKGSDYKKLEAKLPKMVEKYMGPQILQAMGMSIAQFRNKGNELGFQLQKLTDIHFNSNGTNELEAGGDIKYVYIFGAVALLMLIIACINFMNLSTARASKRAREVGVRKVLGSVKGELVQQFLLESILMATISLVFALIIVQLALPAFNNFTLKSLSFGFKSHPFTLLFLIIFGQIVGVLAGIYPAFFLSSFKPIAVLKGKLTNTSKSISLRSGLVVFQFCISICLIIGTTVVYQQLSYIQNKKLGYDKDQLLVLENSWALGKNEHIFRDQLLQDSRITNVTLSAYKPAGPTNSNNSLAYPDEKDSDLMRTLEYGVDDQYIPTLGMKMAQGRNFSKRFPTDSSAIIINETAAKAFGWGENAIGHKITRIVGNDGAKKVYLVIGVVKDFHFKSLHESISPLLMVFESSWGLIVKVKTDDMAGLLAHMKTQWARFNPEEPFTYSFMDDLVNKTYMSEQKTGVILGVFAILTIFIACLGLFGLATFTADQRTKEIGVRKVLGATLGQLIGLLSKDFLKLVLLASVFAMPLAWIVMHKWLQDFAYRIDISWFVFALAAIISIFITLITIIYQALKAATTNPVTSLRSE